MSRIFLAIQVFFRILGSATLAEQIRRLGNDAPQASEPPAPPPAPPKPKKPVRNDAVSLLATLQREARLVDFLQEDLTAYSDQQVGAAVRDVHREAAKALERIFALERLTGNEEGAEIEVAAGFDPAEFHLTGNVTGEPPFRGRVAHHGWRAARCELAEWTGGPQAASVVAPVEVEIA